MEPRAFNVDSGRPREDSRRPSGTGAGDGEGGGGEADGVGEADVVSEAKMATPPPLAVLVLVRRYCRVPLIWVGLLCSIFNG